MSQIESSLAGRVLDRNGFIKLCEVVLREKMLVFKVRGEDGLVREEKRVLGGITGDV